MSDEEISDSGEVVQGPGAFEQIKGMTENFWVANAMEALERLAYFGVRAVLPLYMVGATGIGLGLNFSEKGLIYMIWALIQCLLPMISCGFADTYGYKKSLCCAFSINIVGYVAMAFATGFWSMLGAACLIGTGTALFKPPVQGAVAKSLNEENSALGFGLFYWVVNIGGFIAPMAASALRGNENAPSWNLVFFGAALVTALNFLPTLIFFQEPERDEAEKAKAEKKSPLRVLVDTVLILWRDKPMLKFLLVTSGFWFMFMQLWDLLPNFLDEWVDTRDVGTFLSGLPLIGQTEFVKGLLTATGAAKPEILINIDSFVIILLVIPLSALSKRYSMMTSLVVGMIVSLVGFVLTGMTMVGGIAALAIFLFAIGEIICSPKFNEFIGMAAPADKKAIYMGFANIPFAIGWAAGNGISGVLYDALSSKDVMVRRLLDGKVAEIAVKGEDGAIQMVKLAEAKGAPLYEKAVEVLGYADNAALNQDLWAANHPWIIWPILGAVGLASLIGMVVMHNRAQAQAAAGEDANTAG